MSDIPTEEPAVYGTPGRARFEAWAIVDLNEPNTHIAGYIRDVDVFGDRYCRIDTWGHDPNDPAFEIIVPMTIYCRANYIKCISPTTQEYAENYGKSNNYRLAFPQPDISKLP